MVDDYEILAKCPLFEGVDRADVQAMLGCMGSRVVEYDRGELIFAADGPAQYVGILLAGEARVQRDDFYGNRAVRAMLRPGDLFGETFACAGLARLPVSVEAVQPARALLLRPDRVIKTCPTACAFHNRVVLNMLRVLAAKNLQLSQKLEITSQRTTRDKLLAYLAAQARQAGSASFVIPFDRQGLADYLGVDRSALSAEIGKLRREGALESERSAFTLLKAGDEQGGGAR